MTEPYSDPSTRRIAVIGTAGRDRNSPLSQSLWLAMCRDVVSQLNADDHLISGGAAWADHLAVYAYISGAIDALTLHLPAPLIRNAQGRAMYQELEGPNVKTHTARTANYYHRRFSEMIGYSTLDELYELSESPYVTITEEPVSAGMGAFFARNKRVAQSANAVLAYTFDEGDFPINGGTADTWKKLEIDPANRKHVSLLTLLSPSEREAIKDQSRIQHESLVAARQTARQASPPIRVTTTPKPIALKTARAAPAAPIVAPVVAAKAVPARTAPIAAAARPAPAQTTPVITPIRPQFATAKPKSNPMRPRP